MKSRINYIFSKKKVEDCTGTYEQETYSTSDNTDKELELKEKLFQYLSSETLTAGIDQSELKMLFYEIWEKIAKKKRKNNALAISF
ncbi:MAG: hypothetical protein LBV47_04575 [Bacteroidales bacterium]|jgi:uncharacterized protein (DUF2225 family)|nr:hypothetical protein [Bacteroidales bacterium]